MRKSFFFLALVSLLLTVSCGGGGSSSGSGSALFTGTWTGNETGTQGGVAFSQTANLILTQAGSSVTGTWNTSSGTVGTISGTASGSSINNFTITQNGSCPGTGTGNAYLSDNVISGSISGTFGSCGAVTATVSLIKQTAQLLSDCSSCVYDYQCASGRCAKWSYFYQCIPKGYGDDACVIP